MRTEPTQLALKEEFEFYLKHQDELVSRHEGRIVAIKGHQLLGVYDNYGQAISETTKEHALGTFLLQKVSLGNADYTATFHSRVSFPD